MWKATDKKGGQICALKKIFDAFQNATDAQRTFREIAFLQASHSKVQSTIVCASPGHGPCSRETQELNHENIIKLHNVLKADNDRDIYLVFEYMGTPATQASLGWYGVMSPGVGEGGAGRRD